MDLGLGGSTAIVTGGSRGIGRAIAQAFLTEGVTTVVTSRDPVRAAAVADALSTDPDARATATGLGLQLADPASVTAMVAAAAERLGSINILVNCGADVSGYVAEDFDHVTDAFAREAFDVKFLGALRCCQAVAPHMKGAGWGRIITIGGHTSRHAGAVAAGARNAALVNLSAAMAQALGPHGINTAVVHPATTITETFTERMTRVAERRGTDAATHAAGLAAGNAIRRLVDAREVADVVTFLASPRASGITGEVVAVTGGAGASVYY